MSNSVIKKEFEKASTYFIWLHNSAQHPKVFTEKQLEVFEKQAETLEPMYQSMKGFGGYVYSAKQAISDYLQEQGESPNVAVEVVNDVFGPTWAQLVIQCRKQTKFSFMDDRKEVMENLGFEITDWAKKGEIWEGLPIACCPHPNMNI